MPLIDVQTINHYAAAIGPILGSAKILPTIIKIMKKREFNRYRNMKEKFFQLQTRTLQYLENSSSLMADTLRDIILAVILVFGGAVAMVGALSIGPHASPLDKAANIVVFLESIVFFSGCVWMLSRLMERLNRVSKPAKYKMLDEIELMKIHLDQARSEVIKRKT